MSDFHKIIDKLCGSYDAFQQQKLSQQGISNKQAGTDEDKTCDIGLRGG